MAMGSLAKRKLLAKVRAKKGKTKKVAKKRK